MKFSNRLLVVCITMLSLGGIIFLWLLKSEPRQPQSREALPRREKHSHPHPHETRDRNTPSVADVDNVEKKNDTLVNDTQQIHSQGIRNAFNPAMELWQTNPELATETLHDIAKNLGEDDPKWTEFYHLLGHSIVERPPGAPKDGAYLTLEDAQRYYLLKHELMGLTETDKKHAKELQMRLQWNRNGKQVGQQTQPIRDLLDWMKENAPAEWNTVNTYYRETLPTRNMPPTVLTEESWRTIEDRVNIQYDTFFEALEKLPENALTLQELFDSSHDVAWEKLSSGKMIGAEPPPLEMPQAPTHTWDMVHEAPVEVPATSQESIGNSPPPGTLTSDPETDTKILKPSVDPEAPQNWETALEKQFSQERFNRAISTFTQYGPEEGLRRLKKNDPELASHIEKHLREQQ